MKQMTLKKLGWAGLEEFKFIAGDRGIEPLPEGEISWVGFETEPYFCHKQQIWLQEIEPTAGTEICTEPHPMAQFPEHTLIEIVVEE